MKKTLIGVLAVLGGVMAPIGVSAQLIANSDEPVDITGDSLELVDDIATWQGNVRALQGEAILTADKLVATLDDDGGFRTITALGGVRYSNGKEVVAGERAVYDAVERSITISENVVVTQGETVMTGGVLVYWLDTGRITFNAPEGQRIRGIFHSKSGAPQL